MAARRRHLAAVPDPRRRCRTCHNPMDPAGVIAGDWVEQPDGTSSWTATGQHDAHPSCQHANQATREAS